MQIPVVQPEPQLECVDNLSKIPQCQISLKSVQLFSSCDADKETKSRRYPEASMNIFAYFSSKRT
jgi:hypothetical protein